MLAQYKAAGFFCCCFLVYLGHVNRVSARPGATEYNMRFNHLLHFVLPPAEAEG